ncbi:caspase Dronc-like [Onthophagus taurus]|uniref:caspase Dronc-like n=1 Tax=Onthophagus taurus TaxID=166361 RepID=UPI0039BEA900
MSEELNRDQTNIVSPRNVTTTTDEFQTVAMKIKCFQDKINLSNNKESSSSRHQSDSKDTLKIKVKKTGLYKNGSDSKVPTYNTQSLKDRGKLLLINNINFEMEGRTRNGSKVDQENIVELFTQLGFSIVQEKNKTKSEIESIIKSFASNQDLEKYDMCVTIVMSHGGTIDGQTVIETIDGQSLSTKWIVEQFYGSRCEGMIDKPKIFIFQCCRNPIEIDVKIDSQIYSCPVLQQGKIRDVLICYSTLPGFSAHRDTISGSWYINDLCRIFMDHAHDTDVEGLLKMVDQKLSNHGIDGSDLQTSTYESLGFKVCYLNPR